MFLLCGHAAQHPPHIGLVGAALDMLAAHLNYPSRTSLMPVHAQTLVFDWCSHDLSLQHFLAIQVSRPQQHPLMWCLAYLMCVDVMLAIIICMTFDAQLDLQRRQSEVLKPLWPISRPLIRRTGNEHAVARRMNGHGLGILGQASRHMYLPSSSPQLHL